MRPSCRPRWRCRRPCSCPAGRSARTSSRGLSDRRFPLDVMDGPERATRRGWPAPSLRYMKNVDWWAHSYNTPASPFLTRFREWRGELIAALVNDLAAPGFLVAGMLTAPELAPGSRFGTFLRVGAGR